MSNANPNRPMIRAFKTTGYASVLGVHIEQIDPVSGKIWIAKPVEMVELTNLSEEQYPMLRLEPTAAQVLMDDLWNCGVRPTEGTGSAGSLAATQKHLADMRTIAFRKLQIAEVMQ